MGPALQLPRAYAILLSMKIRFSPDSARRETTPVDNLYISEYLPDADGTAVKVYLYGLMQCRFPSMSEISLGDALSLTPAAVLTAFVYWQSRGLVRIRSEEPLEVEYLTVEQPALTEATPVKYRGFIRSLNELIAPRRFTLNEMKHVYDCIETFRLEERTVLELISYCMENKGKNVSIQYIVTVAKSWAERGVFTPEQARAYIESAALKKHGASEVLRRWNKRRQPTVDEMELYDKWVREWGFDEEAILSVCPRLTAVGTPTFLILDEQLEALYKQHKTQKTDIEEEARTESGEKEFARMVFARMGKVEPPTRTNISQLNAYMGAEGLSREVILLAAEECEGADRPFGKLKTLLKDWSEKGVKTVEEAQKLLQANAAKPSRKKAAPYSGYAQRSPQNVNFDDISLDLNDDI